MEIMWKMSVSIDFIACERQNQEFLSCQKDKHVTFFCVSLRLNTIIEKRKTPETLSTTSLTCTHTHSLKI